MDIKSERRLIWLLAAVQFTHIMDFMIMMPLGPELQRIFAIDALQFGALVSTYTAAAALASLLSALILDRFDRRSVLLFNYLLFAVSTLACAFAESYTQLMVARSLAGFFGGMMGVVVQTIVADVVPFGRRGAAMGKMMAAFSVATVAGVPLGLMAANAMGWHAPFLILAGLSSLMYALVYRWVPSLTGHLGDTVAPMVMTFLKVLGTRRYWLAYAFAVPMIFTGFVVIPFVTLHLQGGVGLSPEQIPTIYFVGGFATLFSAPFIGKLADRYGKDRVFIFLAIAAIAPLYLVTHLQSGDWLKVILTTTLFFVVISGRMIPAMAIISEVPDPKQRGAYMSLNSAVQSAAMALAALVGGWLAGGSGGQLENYALNGYVSIGASFLSIGLLLLVLRSMARAKQSLTSSPLDTI